LVIDAMTVAISNVVFLLGGIKRQATPRPLGGAIKQLKRFSSRVSSSHSMLKWSMLLLHAHSNADK
jgi:hypothetical protein